MIGVVLTKGSKSQKSLEKLDASLKHVSCAGRARRTDTDRIELQRYRTDTRVKYFTYRGGTVHFQGLIISFTEAVFFTFFYRECILIWDSS